MVRAQVEQISDYRVRHGEAVATGIALDVIIHGRWVIRRRERGENSRAAGETGLRTFANENAARGFLGANFVVLKGLEEFREHLGGQLTSPAAGVGRGFEVHEMDASTVLTAHP